jgi:hypothetical protein
MMSDQRWLRKYVVTVVLSDGTTALIVSSSEDDKQGGALRCTFHVERPGYTAIYYAEVTLYNLTADTDKIIRSGGKRVIVEAGYESGPFGVIFDGDIFQVMWDRENVTDYKLTMNCVDGDRIFHDNFVSVALEARSYQSEIIDTMARNSRVPIPVDYVTPDISQQVLPRGKVLFGEPKKYFQQIASGNEAQLYVCHGKVGVVKIQSDQVVGEAFVISPDNGLIGTPQQTEDGVVFRTLLNPEIAIKSPPMWVKLDMTAIRQVKLRLGQLQTMLDQDGFYRVAQVVHLGDTRGNEWYTDVVGITYMGKLAAMLDTAQGTPQG